MQLGADDIKAMAVDAKWLAALHAELDRVSQTLVRRVKQLAELEIRVNRHLEKMGFVWK